MKSIRVSRIISMLAVITAITILFSIRVFAVPAATTDQFTVEGNSYGTAIKVNTAIPNGLRGQIEMCDVNGTPVSSKDWISSTTGFYDVAKNTVYLFRVRFYEHTWDSSARKYVDTFGEWSGFKAASTIAPTASLTSRRSKKVKIKIPKMAGVKNVVLYMSTSTTTGFKKVATIKPGKTKVISKFKGKSFKTKKWYYYRIQINLQNGIPCEDYFNGFQIRVIG